MRDPESVRWQKRIVIAFAVVEAVIIGLVLLSRA